MKKVIIRHARLGCAVILGVMMSQCPRAWAGWTGTVNGSGVGWAQSWVTSVTTNRAVAQTATNVPTKNPSAAISPAAGYIATNNLPKGASTSTYSKTLTGTGYQLQNATVAAGGDKTDDTLLNNTGSQFLSSTFLQVLGYTNYPSNDPNNPNTSYYTFNIYTVGTDSGYDTNYNPAGAAQLVRVLDLSLAPGFDPATSVIYPPSDQNYFYWQDTNGTQYSVYIYQVQVGWYSQGNIYGGGEGEGVGVGLAQPAGSPSPNPSPYGNNFNAWGGWQLSDTINTYYEATNDPSYVYLDFHGTTASLPPGPGDTLIAQNFNKTTICTNATIWFNSVLKLNWPCQKRGTISFVNQIISGLNGQPPISVPDAQVIFDPTVRCATTVFTNNMWVTTAPAFGLSGNTFLSAVSLPLPNGLPGGNKNVTWSGTFVTSTAGVKPQWAWSAAVYKSFPTNLCNVAVKAADGGFGDCRYSGCSDTAGTPEGWKQFLTGGACGGGNGGGGFGCGFGGGIGGGYGGSGCGSGGNWTGVLSGSCNVIPHGP